MNQENIKNRKASVALVSIFASLFLSVMNFVVGFITGSLGVLSVAAHGAMDFGVTLLTFFAVRIGDKPADKRHPYGHAKAESVSALIETGLLFIISSWIIYEAISRLMFKNVFVKTTWYAIAAIIISIAVDLWRSNALRKTAKQTRSQALEADALHFTTDIFSSSAVLIGLLFTKFGIMKADSVAAMVVAVFVAVAGYRLGKRTINVLIDAAPEGLIDQIVKVVNQIEGVISIEKIRVRPAGAFVFVDIIINVSHQLPLDKAQAICKRVEEKIDEIVMPPADITAVANPVALDSETITERIKITALNRGLSIHNVTLHLVGDKKYVNFDLEVNRGLNIDESHRIASGFEELIKNEIGGEVEVNSHIEQSEPRVIESEKVFLPDEDNITRVIGEIASTIKEIENVHDIRIIKANQKLFISLHCFLGPKIPVEEAHNIANRLEYLIRARILNTERVVVHTEST